MEFDWILPEGETPSAPSLDAPFKYRLAYLLNLIDHHLLLQAAPLYLKPDETDLLAGILTQAQNSKEMLLCVRIRLVGDALIGELDEGLFEATFSYAWQRLFELCERVEKQQLPMDEALALAANIDFQWQTAQSLLAVLRRFVRLEPSSAISLVFLANEVLSHSPDVYDVSGSLGLLALTCHRLGDNPKARFYAASAVSHCQEANDPKALFDALASLATVSEEKEALAVYEQCLTLAHHGIAADSILKVGYYLGALLFKHGRPDECVRRCAAIIEQFPQVKQCEQYANVVTMLQDAAEQCGVAIDSDKLNLSEPEPTAMACYQQAVAAQQDEQIALALSWLYEAERLAKAQQQWHLLSNVLAQRGIILTNEGEYQSAIEAMLGALHYATPQGFSYDTWSLLFYLSRLYECVEQPKQAEVFAKRALVQAQRQKDTQKLFDILQHLASLMVEKDQDLGIAYMDWAMSLYQSEPLPEALHEQLLSLLVAPQYDAVLALCANLASHAAVIELVGEHGLRLQAQNESLELCSRLLVALCHESSNLTVKCANVVKAVMYLHQLEQYALAQTLLDPLLGEACQQECCSAFYRMQLHQLMGVTLRVGGEYQEAVLQYQQALAIAEYLDDEMSLGDIHGKMAIAYRYLAQYDKACNSYELAIAMAEKYHQFELCAQHQMNLAALLVFIGHTAQAQALLLQALKGYQAHNMVEMAERCGLFILSHFSFDELPLECQSQLERILADIDNSPYLSNRAVALMWRAKTLASQKCYDQALSLSNQANELWQSINDAYNLNSSLLNQARMLYDGDKDLAKNKLHQAKAMALATQQQALVIECDEQMLHFALKEQDSEAVIALFDILLPCWQTQRRSLSQDQDRVAFFHRVRGFIEQGVTWYLQQHDVIRVFELLEWARAAALNDLLAVSQPDTSEPGSLSYGQVQQFLQSSKRPLVFVTLSLLGNQLIAMTARKAQPRPSLTPIAFDGDAINDLMAKFQLEVLEFRGMGFSSWQQQAAAIMDFTCQVVKDDELVVLAVDEQLQALPLHCVKLSDGKALVERASVVYTPNLTQFIRLSKKAKRRQKLSLLSVGVSFVDEALAVMQPAKGIALVGESIDKESLKGFMTDISIVHFSCHGYFDSHNPLESGLILTDSETPLAKDILSVRELMSWRLSNDLITLSACESARGKVAVAEFLGLTRTILSCGVNSILATLWSVDASTTDELMQAFYTELYEVASQGQEVCVATVLAKVQRQMMAKYHYYHWAAFKLTGWPQLDVEAE